MRYFVAKREDRRLDSVARTTLRGSFVNLSDGITHYELLGPDGGDVVVLVGGLTIPLFYWDRCGALLREAGFRTLAYSGYGRGFSDRIPGPYDGALFTRQIAELVGFLDLKAPHHILGSSMGALVAMDYVRNNAASVATLTIAGPAGLAHEPITMRMLLSRDECAAFVARHFGRRWLDQHEARNLSDRTYAGELSAMLHEAYRYEGSLHAIFDTVQNFGLFDRMELFRTAARAEVRRLLIWGRDDRVTPIKNLGEAEKLLQPERCHVLNCGHMTPFERPREVADLLACFVKGYDVRRASCTLK